MDGRLIVEHSRCVLLATRTLQKIVRANGLTQASIANEIVTCELDESVQLAMTDGTGKFACWQRA